MTALLSVEGIGIRFGGVQAVDDVSFALETGDLVGLIGPNGAGKTTALRLITGVLRPDSGRVLLAGRDVTRLPTHARVRRGIALTHQIVRPFRSMSVLDNVALAAGLARTRRALGALVGFGREKEKSDAGAALARVGLAGLEEAATATLPLGRLKRLEVARALALRPKVLLLDEPLAGLNQQEATELADVILALNREGMTVVLVEHNLSEVLRVSRRLIVLDGGHVIGDGPTERVMAMPAVREAYVGARGEGDAEP